jgi:hypothetical protein
MSDAETMSAGASPSLEQPTQPPSRRFVFAGVGSVFVITLLLTVSAPVTVETDIFAPISPGFWVFWVALISTVLLGVTLLRRGILMDGAAFVDKQEWLGLLRAAPIIIATVPLLTLFGVAITAVVVAVYWMLVVTKTAWLRSLLIGLAISGVTLAIFLYLLKVPFPAGSVTGF